jgi:hypothetical protein
MNNLVPPYLVACAILSCVSPLAAKDQGNLHMKKDQTVRVANATSGPSIPRSQSLGNVSEKPAIFIASSQPAKESEKTTARSIHRADGFDVLGRPTPQRRMVAAGTGKRTYTVSKDSYQNGLALIASLYGQSGKSD